MPTSEATPPPPRSGLRGILLVASVAIFVGLLYAWCLTTHEFAERGYPFRWRYYPLLVEGWLQGRLDLPIPVPAGLLALPDPYDPKTNVEYRFGQHGIHDLTLSKGRVYMYWGPTPALVAFLPWRLITGAALATPWAAWAFMFGGWLACATLLMRLARRSFPDAGIVALIGALLALGLCNWAPVVLRRADVYETAIAAEFFFIALAWCCLAECLWSPEPRRVAWLAAAGVAFGLAVGARPNCIFGAGVLLVPWLFDARNHRRWTHAAAALIPVAIAVLALLLHNYLRFGNALDFGQQNQLNGDSHAPGVAHFSPGYALYNVRAYLFSAPRWSDYFPFILPPATDRMPAGYQGIENVYGLLVTVPFLWLGGGLCFNRLERRVAAVATMLVVTAGFALALLLGFHGAATRYELECAPALALLAAISVLAWEQRFVTRAWPRRIGRVIWGGLLLVSSVTTMAASWQYAGFFPQTDPETSDALARVSNRAAIALGLAPAQALRAVELAVKFPPASTDRASLDIFVSTGAGSDQDAVIADYPTADTIRIGFAHANNIRFSAPFPLERATVHRIRIELGSFRPPAAHPFWDGVAPDEMQRQRRHAQIFFDGRPLLRATEVDLFDAVRARPTIGGLIDSSEPLPPFSGAILEQREFWDDHP